MTTDIERSVPWERIKFLPGLGGQPKMRHFLRVEGTSVGDTFVIHNHNLKNAVRAVRERVFAVEVDGKLVAPVKPKDAVFTNRLGSFRADVLIHLRHCTPWTIDQFVESYTGSKRLRYERARDSLQRGDFTVRDAWCEAFVKAECTDLTLKPDPASRLIQPRGARFNVLVGRFIRPLEHQVYAAIGLVFGGPTVMKGYNAYTTAAMMREMWEAFDHPISVALDASRFDQHVSRAALEWEHSVYLGCYKGNKELAMLLRLQLKNKGYVRTPEGTLEYEVEGCRMSGDMNTALGNCLIMCALIHAYAALRKIRVRLANNGDDCAVFMEAHDERRFVNGLSEWFKEMGFSMKMDGVSREFEEVEFCQTRPIFDGSRWRMCRSPYTGMCKDSLCKQPDLSGKTIEVFRTWAASVGTAGLSLTDGLPVFPEAYKWFQRLGAGGTRGLQGFGDMSSGFEHMAKGLSYVGLPVTEEARFSFWKAWGMTPDFQLALEREFACLGECLTVAPMISRSDFHGISDTR